MLRDNIYADCAREVLALENLEINNLKLCDSFIVGGLPYAKLVDPIFASYYLPSLSAGSKTRANICFLLIVARMLRDYIIGEDGGIISGTIVTPGKNSQGDVFFLNFSPKHYSQVFAALDSFAPYRDRYSTICIGLWKNSENGSEGNNKQYNYKVGNGHEGGDKIDYRLLADFEKLALSSPQLSPESFRIRENYFRLMKMHLRLKAPRLGAFARSAAEMFSNTTPRLVCAGDFCDVRCRVFFLLAKQFSVPTFVIQQGLVDYKQSDLFFPVSDLVALWNEETLRVVRDMGVSRAEFIVTGNPGYDKYFVPNSAVNVVDKTALFLSQPAHRHGISKSKMDRMKRSILLAFPEKGKYKLIIKPHPDESPNYYKKLVKELGGVSAEILSPDADTSLYILKSYAIIGFYSTSLMEAIAADKPIMVFDEDAQYNTYAPYERKGAALGVKNAEGIQSFLRDYRASKQLRERLRTGRCEFLKENFPLPQGKATERVFSAIE